LVKVAQSLSVTARGVNTKIPQTVKSLLDTIESMKSNVLDLEEAMRSSGGPDDNIIDTSLASQLAGATRALSMATHEVIRSTSVVASNYEGKSMMRVPIPK